MELPKVDATKIEKFNGHRYRIVQEGEKVYPQKRYLFFFWSSLYYCYGSSLKATDYCFSYEDALSPIRREMNAEKNKEIKKIYYV